MREMNAAERAAFRYFDNIGDREITRREMTDELIRIGSIEDGAEAFRAFQEKQALDLMRRHRKTKEKRGETQLEIVSLWRRDEDGDKKHYLKPCGHLTTPEAVQHVRYWDKVIAEDQAKRERYYQFHLEQHGKRFQRMLSLAEQTAGVN